MNYKGYEDLVLNDEELSELYQNNSLENYSFLENEYGLIRDKSNKIIDYIKFQDGQVKNVGFPIFESRYTGKVVGRNPQQRLAMDMLLDPSIEVKLLAGGYGCGKDYLMINAALEALEKNQFEKIVWVRNNIEVKDSNALGSLPGDEISKLLPWIMVLADHVGGIDGVYNLIESGKVEPIHIGFIRGRDIKNSIIYSTEAENLTTQHVQLLLGRVGEGSNLWINGDWRQRDKKVFEKNSGLETTIEKLKGNRHFGYVHLEKSERSKIAALADLLD